ncbi:MAG: protein phosphatase 2C domain-containing protein [Pelolinea sp.]|nr:protein phosphatase 2C domain-containing protein [Pelolinea sp.]
MTRWRIFSVISVRWKTPPRALREVVVDANLAVLEASAGSPELEGMGATCICALIVEKTLYIAGLGDSRAYLLRGRTIRQLNYDHTLLEETAGIDLPGIKGITRNHPLAHVLSRYLGSAHPAPVDTRVRPEKKIFQKDAPAAEGLDLKNGDRILLCSDGLTDMLTDEEIRAAVKGKAPQKDVQQLVLCALEKGGHDNVSVILIEIP